MGKRKASSYVPAKTIGTGRYNKKLMALTKKEVSRGITRLRKRKFILKKKK